MGQGASYFTEEEQEEILEETKLSPKYLMEIQKRYSNLDASKSKDETVGVPVKDILLIPEIHQHKLGYLFAEKLGGRSGLLYPKDFVNLFSALSTARPPSEKLKILFDLLDVRRFGYIGGIELYRFYHLLFSPALDNDQIEAITRNAIKVCGEKIDFAKFQTCFPLWQVVEKMTVELQLTE
uniref:Uncharacterized protein LOC100176273 n=1 Tax=Phallusia mammillata TaxID=59560 RepID=A0A6F9DFQ4_9ASCI|nr:uncharacterized protein LOC100176273 [Phallusia mammillata]